MCIRDSTCAGPALTSAAGRCRRATVVQATASNPLTMRKVGRSLNRIMRRIQAAEARKNISSLVQKSQAGERIKVTRYNKTAAVLVPKRDLEPVSYTHLRAHETGR